HRDSRPPIFPRVSVPSRVQIQAARAAPTVQRVCESFVREPCCATCEGAKSGSGAISANRKSWPNLKKPPFQSLLYSRPFGGENAVVNRAAQIPASLDTVMSQNTLPDRT